MRQRKRIREWLEVPGRFPPGLRNAITDVEGVSVGHETLIEGKSVRTGVTIIKPHAGDPYRMPVPCAIYAANGFGKLTGSVQIEELGLLESLIGLTNTLSVAQVLQGILDFHLQYLRPEDMSVNVLVGETNDCILNDIRGFHIRPEHVEAAIRALGRDVAEGCVGAGTGTRCFGMKGGIGTSSRVISGTLMDGRQDYTVGALVQTNFDGNLNIYGRSLPRRDIHAGRAHMEPGGSCMILLATDAPLCARQLKRIAKRGITGMTMTGSYLAHDSGDICVAFSNFAENMFERHEHGLRSWTLLPDTMLNPLFEATVEAVQEAIYNSLTMATDMRGINGAEAPALNMEDFFSATAG